VILHALLLLLLVVQAIVPVESAAAAEPVPEERVSSYLEAAAKRFTVIQKCEADGGEEIVVCGRRGESERYRLPIRPQGFDAAGPVDSVSRERHRLIQEGDSGVGSCSTSGPGGWTGCFHQQTKRRCQQKPCGVAF
jgi:hypothetical protein